MSNVKLSERVRPDGGRHHVAPWVLLEIRLIEEASDLKSKIIENDNKAFTRHYQYRDMLEVEIQRLTELRDQVVVECRNHIVEIDRLRKELDLKTPAGLRGAHDD